MVAGFVLGRCAELHAGSARAWAEYAGWCYRQALASTSASAGGLAQLTARVAAALCEDGSAGDAGGVAAARVAEAVARACAEGAEGGARGESAETAPREAVRMAALAHAPWAGSRALDAVERVSAHAVSAASVSNPPRYSLTHTNTHTLSHALAPGACGDARPYPRALQIVRRGLLRVSPSLCRCHAARGAALAPPVGVGVPRRPQLLRARCARRGVG
jgi:hypothetical protein